MPLIIPNSIENDTPADAAELQQNFATVQSYVNTNLLNRDGSVALTAPLLLPGDPTLANQAANKGYVDGRDDLKLNQDGSESMTGPLIVQDVAKIMPRADIPTVALFTNKTASTAVPAAGFGVGETGNLQAVTGIDKTFAVYTTAAGPTYTNRLQVSDTAITTALPISAAGTITAGNYIKLNDAPTAADHATRKDYVDAQVATALNQTEGDARYVSLTGESGLTNNFLTTGAFMSGSTAPAHNSNGSIIRSDGAVVSAVNTGASAGSLANFVAIRGGTVPNDVGGVFARFMSGTTTIGEIEIGPTTSTTRYLTSSDYRLKEELGSVEDAVERLDRLRPIRFAWKADGVEQDGFFAHEVDDVVPAAVSGEKDAVNDEGVIIPQMIDNNQLVPLLVAAVQQLTARVAELEAA